MEDQKKKKKKLTLSISSKKSHNVPYYAQSRGKTSVIIEKKISRRWGEKKIQSRDNNITKHRATDNFTTKKPPINLIESVFFPPEPNLIPSSSAKFWTYPSIKKLLAHIRKMKKKNLNSKLISYTHWRKRMNTCTRSSTARRILFTASFKIPTSSLRAKYAKTKKIKLIIKLMILRVQDHPLWRI